MMKNLKLKTRKFMSQRRARRFKINNKINNKITYNYRGNVQTYGPGFAAVNIDYDVRRDIVGEQLLDYTIQQLLVSSDQFYKYREQYNLFKITNFYVIMFPDDNANNENTYLNVDWFNTINIDNIQTCEWSKIMYNDRKSKVVFRFKPLNMNIEQNRTPDTAVVNPRQYIYTANIASYPGHIKIYHNGDTKIRCKIVFRILFRRPEPPTQPEEVEPNIISRVERELDEVTKKDIENDRYDKVNNNKDKKIIKNKKVIKQDDVDRSFQEFNKSLNRYGNMLNKLKNNKDNDNDKKIYDYLKDKFVIMLRKFNNIKKKHKIKDQKAIDKWKDFTIKQQFKKLKNKEDKNKEVNKENKENKEDKKIDNDIKLEDSKVEDKDDNNGLNQSSILRLVNQAQEDYNEFKDIKNVERNLHNEDFKKRYYDYISDRIRKKKEEEEDYSDMSSLFNDDI